MLAADQAPGSSRMASGMCGYAHMRYAHMRYLLWGWRRCLWEKQTCHVRRERGANGVANVQLPGM
jgi:hypothetical protein